MANNLDATLDALFKGASPPPPVVAASTANAPAHSSSANASPGVAQTAAEHYNRALNALKTGDWTLFGNEMQALGKELAQPPNSAGH